MGSGKVEELLNNIPYDFRWAREDEWKSAMIMVWKTFMSFDSPDYSEEGVKEFFEFITDDDIYKAFLKGTYRVMLALDGDRIIGVGSIRNMNVLSLLFVDGEYHHKGVGSVLIELLGDYVKRRNGELLFKVKSSPYAVGFYKEQGFYATGEEQVKAGIRVTPMEKRL